VSIPDVDETTGYLPPGVHEATLAELVNAFGWNSRRRELLAGLRKGLSFLKHAGCRRVFVNGSFVTSKENPGDIDVCWDEDGVDPEKLDPVLLEFANKRAAQKAKFGCEFFIASWDADGDGEPFTSFFRHDREGVEKGIVLLSLEQEKDL
jgi:hypothetical protein